MKYSRILLLCVALITVGYANENIGQDEFQEELYVPAIYDENMDQHIYKESTHLRSHIEWNTTEIFVMEDDTIWMVHPLEVQQASWWDRLRGNTIVQPSDRFLTKASEWKDDAELKIYSFGWKKSGLSEIYNFDASKLVYCTHLIENVPTGEMVFARPLKNGQVLQLFNTWVKEVYGKGFIEGYKKGAADAKQIQS